MILFSHGFYLFHQKDYKLLSMVIFYLLPLPQRDHISPLLFLLFINDTTSMLKHSNMDYF